MTTDACPACASDDIRSVGRLGPVPVLCGSLWDSREAAVATPTAEMDLSICNRCAHLWNTAFDPGKVDYDAKYDNALDFSPVFREYAAALVARLVDEHDLHGRKIVEIGSGKGEFLRALCTEGGNRGLGYDPTYEGPERDGPVEFVREFFTPGTSPSDVDLVVCRHVLEHLADPYAFLLDIRRSVGDRPVPMYFEVPNADFNFAESGPWDLIYPHVSYFNPASLEAVLRRAGFRVSRLEPTFGGQFIGADVVPGEAEARPELAAGRLEAVRGYAQAFDRQLDELARWRARIAVMSHGGPVAVWGAGSKGVTFLALTDGDCRVSVVDVNPRKWGRFLPGGGHEVVPPTAVTEPPVHTVLVMNPAYTAEISSQLAELGSPAAVVTV